MSENLDKFTETAFAEISKYAHAAVVFAEDDIPLKESLKIVLPIGLEHQLYDDAIAAWNWIQSNDDAIFIYQAAIMMFPENFAVVNANIEANVGVGSWLPESAIIVTAAHQFLSSIGTMTVRLDEMDEEGLESTGLRGACRMIQTLRHGPLDDPVVEDENDDELENDELENEEPNVAGAA